MQRWLSDVFLMEFCNAEETTWGIKYLIDPFIVVFGPNMEFVDDKM